ncbi:MAG: sulfur oxidation c-type cytochrome SoxA [Casimicrobiaceae bacterium]|nr:sulfur oxidation c-type cytochrome SoxA [Casimicrobiaceae bacterium]MCX8097920.1 sulfur oxidation c-type cytochrome SoxA [Casimicrobiaceae bacterium]MDW8312744.1 sulfur oxidation c-type cytochrome SoxA [Burkholderiales bacterium]
MKCRTVFASVAGAFALIASSVGLAQQDTQKEIERYRQLLADGNPAELLEMRGEQLWKERRGPKNASLERCDLGLGPGVVKGAYARLPRYFADVDRVMDAETRLLHCQMTLQGFTLEELTRRPYSLNPGERQTDHEALVAYIVGQSRGEKVQVPQSHPKEIESFRRGERMFFWKGGPFDFSCSNCHAVDNQRIRLQDLPNFDNPANAQRAFTTWPAYRVSQGAMRTMQWRLYDCFRQQRFPELKLGSQAAIDLITYMGVKANGGTMDAPAIKR